MKRKQTLLFLTCCVAATSTAQSICMDHTIIVGSGGLDLWGISAGQLNDDTLLDIVVSNHLTYDLSVFFGNGDATFQPCITIPLGVAAPVDVVAADLNNDGMTDLAAAAQGDLGAYVILNLGGGVFDAPVGYELPGYNPWTLEVNDVDGDGILDLAVPNGYLDGGLAIFHGNGDGTFAPANVFATDVDPVSLDLADMNNDGYLDAVYSHLTPFSETNHYFSILWGNGPGTFGTRTHVPCPFTSLESIAADVDGDGIMDVLTSNFSDGSISKHIGHGDGTFDPAVTFPAFHSTMGIQLHDIDLDGNKDLVIAEHGGNSVDIMPGDGAGNFGTLVRTTAAVDPIDFAVGNFNADSYPDVMLAGADGPYFGVVVNCLSTGVVDPAGEEQITVFPNPADEAVRISLPAGARAMRYTIIDAQGRMVANGSVINRPLELDTRSLSAGLYTVLIGPTVNGRISERFEVIHQ